MAQNLEQIANIIDRALGYRAADLNADELFLDYDAADALARKIGEANCRSLLTYARCSDKGFFWINRKA